MYLNREELFEIVNTSVFALDQINAGLWAEETSFDCWCTLNFSIWQAEETHWVPSSPLVRSLLFSLLLKAQRTDPL